MVTKRSRRPHDDVFLFSRFMIRWQKNHSNSFCVDPVCQRLAWVSSPYSFQTVCWWEKTCRPAEGQFYSWRKKILEAGRTWHLKRSPYSISIKGEQCWWKQSLNFAQKTTRVPNSFPSEWTRGIAVCFEALWASPQLNRTEQKSGILNSVISRAAVNLNGTGTKANAL